MILFKEIKMYFEDYRVIRVYGEHDGKPFYMYVSKDVFQQAVILFDWYQGDIQEVLNALEVEHKNIKAIEQFFEIAPEPLNILGAYLVYAPEMENFDFEVACGYLHQMSKLIDFNEFSKLPTDVRNLMKFRPVFLNKYEQSWELLQKEAIVFAPRLSEQDIKELAAELANHLSLNVSAQPMQRTESTQSTSEDEDDEADGAKVDEEEVEEEPEEEDPFAELASLVDIWNEMDENGGYEDSSSEEKEEEEDEAPMDTDSVLDDLLG